MEKFNLFGQEIIFSDAECRHKEIDGIYLLRSKEAYDEYMDFYKNTSREEPGKFIQALKNKCFNIVKGNLEKLQKDLIETKIYSYDLERLTTEYSTQIWGVWSTRIEDLEDEFNTIIEEKNNEIQYRNIRKESRGKWQGGGFGVTGALKGAATAGVFNGITGAGHTVVNVLGNASTRSQTRKKLRDLVNNKSYCSELATDLQMQIKQLKKVYIHILNKEIGEHIKEYSSKDMLEHARVCGNMESVLDDTEKKCLILKLIKLYPYDIMQYKYAIEKFGDAYGEIEAISTFFNLEVKDYKINLLNKELKDVDYTDEKSMLQVKEALMIREKELGIENSELTKMLENKLTEFDIKMRTVADIDSTYVKKQKNKAVLKNGTQNLYETREKAEEIRNKISEIISLYDSISFDSETSIKNTKKKLEKIFNEYSVGKTVILELKDRLNIIDEEARTVLGEIFTTREAAEIERKRVAGNVKYDTEEEAKQANKELETIEYIKTKSNSDSRLLDKIKTFKELGSIEFTKTQSKEIVLQEEKEIITLYNIKQDQIKEMPRRIVKCLLLIIISSIICIHFVPPMFAGKLFWKVVAVFCVLWVLSSIINMYDELKKDFKLKKELKTINNLISIKGNNIIYK